MKHLFNTLLTYIKYIYFCFSLNDLSNNLSKNLLNNLLNNLQNNLQNNLSNNLLFICMLINYKVSICQFSNLNNAHN